MNKLKLIEIYYVFMFHILQTRSIASYMKKTVVRLKKKIISSENNILSDRVTAAPLFPSDLFQRSSKTDFANLRVRVRLVLRAPYTRCSLFFFPTKHSSLLTQARSSYRDINDSWVFFRDRSVQRTRVSGFNSIDDVTVSIPRQPRS